MIDFLAFFIVICLMAGVVISSCFFLILMILDHFFNLPFDLVSAMNVFWFIFAVIMCIDYFI